jgi:hypothetical protein
MMHKQDEFFNDVLGMYSMTSQSAIQKRSMENGPWKIFIKSKDMENHPIYRLLNREEIRLIPTVADERIKNLFHKHILER